MTRQLQNIEEVTEVVTPARTILDQILDLPVESIVIAVRKGEVGASFVLHRTGRNGWLATRHVKGGGYLNREDVEAWYNDRVDAGSTFLVAYEPGRVEPGGVTISDGNGGGVYLPADGSPATFSTPTLL